MAEETVKSVTLKVKVEKDVPLDVVYEEGATPLAYAHEGDAGLDFAANETVTLEPGERKLVGTGVRIAVPDGYVGLLFPRSGNAAKKGLTLANSVGVIDSGYRGEVKGIMVNLGSDPVTINSGERIMQLVLVPFLTAAVTPVLSLEETERGENGFGSTGVVGGKN